MVVANKSEAGYDDENTRPEITARFGIRPILFDMAMERHIRP